MFFLVVIWFVQGFFSVLGFVFVFGVFFWGEDIGFLYFRKVMLVGFVDKG